MNLRSILNKCLVLSVFIIAGFLLARSLYYGSFMGIILALVAIVAWTMFLYKLSDVQSKKEGQGEVPENY